LIRGWLTAGISVFVAALSHVAGGGSAPGQLGLLLALVFAGLGCVALAGKSLSRIRLGLSVALSQFAFHFLFGLGAGLSGASMVSPAAHHHEAVVLELASGPATPPMHSDSSMWMAHVVAALVTMVALRYGESAFWSLVELARTAWVAILLPRISVVESPPVNPVRVRTAIANRLGLRDLEVILSGRPHRGPPSLVALPY